jgi:hypothetical protein
MASSTGMSILWVLTFGRVYGKFGFHPYFLTAFMAASVAAQKMTSAVSRDSALPEGQG